MLSTFDRVKLQELLRDFYTITRIRITVLDDGFQELAAYPRERPAFCRLLREKQLEKTYLASVFGHPPQDAGEIDLPVYKVGGGSLIRVVDARGQQALTRYRVLETAGQTALLELHPMTGRTHQLRLHCMASGFPILGDPQYTGPEAKAYSDAHGLQFQQLCAARLVFPHPMTGERIEICSKQTVFFPKD